jgi:pimeloyl-ACP methyl ester carboxylesterase
MQWMVALAACLTGGDVDEVVSRPGIVIVVDGVGGWQLWGKVSKVALRQSGLPHEVREFYWHHGRGQFLKDLQDERHLNAKAAELADQIERLRDDDPERPIFLVGHSAGAGVILRAAETLRPGSVERIVLLSSAVSPQYDLRGALAATKREIVSFHSPFDQVLLHWGTRQFGTVDRVYTRSAGLKGFEMPRDLGEADRRLYGRLVQIPWQLRMATHGNIGQHVGPCLPGFMLAEVAPWLR